MDTRNYSYGTHIMVFEKTSTADTRNRARQLALILSIQILAFWDAWTWYINRVWFSPQEAIGLLVTLSLLCCVALRSYQDHRKVHNLPILPVALSLLLYAASHFCTTPVILRTTIAVFSLLVTIYCSFIGKRPSVAFWGMILLSLPLVPSLQFYLGYPARLTSAYLTIPLLQLNGIAVRRDGTNLIWQNEILQFDAPCSGITMLWAGLFLTLIICFLHRFSCWQTSVALLIGTTLVLAGNVLRASSLFYIESGLLLNTLGYHTPAWCHEGIGVIAFSITATLIFFTLKRLNEWQLSIIK